MAYPTGVAFKHIGLAMGAQPINESSTVQVHPLGLVLEAVDITYGPGRFVYAKGVASTTKGDVCAYDSKNGDTARAVQAGATSFGPCGVAMSDNVASQYGWYQIEGAGPVAAATALTDAPLYTTATAGTLDDAVVAGYLVTGIVSRAATSAGFATCQIDHPNIYGLSGAAGAALSGTSAAISGTVSLTGTGTNTITSDTTAANASTTVGAFTLKPTATLGANDLVLDVQSAAAAHLLTVDLEGDVVAGGAITATGAVTGTNATLSGGTVALTATTTNLITSATAAATASATVGAFTLKPTVALDANDLVLDVQSSAASHLFTVDQEGDVTALGPIGCTNINKITLTAEAENGGANTIEVEGQVANLNGTATGTVEVMVRSLAVTADKGDLSIGAGADPGTLIKAVNPATGENVAWITTTSAGHFRVTVTNDVAETTLLQVFADGGATEHLKLTFA